MQYSLKAMMTAVLVAAVLCCVLFTLPDLVSVNVLHILTVLLASTVVALIVYGRGSARAFAIGCAPPVGVFIWHFTSVWAISHSPFVTLSMRNSIPVDHVLPLKVTFVVFLAVVVVSGLVGVFTRRWFLPEEPSIGASPQAAHLHRPPPETHAPAANRRM